MAPAPLPKEPVSVELTEEQKRKVAELKQQAAAAAREAGVDLTAEELEQRVMPGSLN